MRLYRAPLWLAAALLLQALLPGHALGQGDRGIRHIRPHDRSGINIFEAPKQDTSAWEGNIRLSIGGGFAQEYQGLSHSTDAEPNMVNGVDANQLKDIGPGFTNAMANLYLNAQMSRGIRVALTSYLSSRNHNEMWVKDGYLLIDESPVDVPILNSLMEVLTLKVGHFEINYGDAHFRRTDGGNSLYNPFVGNLVMDAFTTEIGAEAYLRRGPWMAMVGITNGEIRGHTDPDSTWSYAYLTKLGFDQQLTPSVRARLTASSYWTARSIKNTLYTGDRAGTHYFDVMDNTSNNWSGNVVPQFSSNVGAVVVNPYLELGDLELFGNLEWATGGSSTEEDRDFRQYAVDGVYRLFDDRAYVAGRYNIAEGRYRGFDADASVRRIQMGVGFFITDNIVAKGEYIRQTYHDFPATDVRHGGEFSGVMLQGAVLF